eukprot:2298000-Pleurochrysis_carterae.AAC.1
MSAPGPPLSAAGLLRARARVRRAYGCASGHASQGRTGRGRAEIPSRWARNGATGQVGVRPRRRGASTSAPCLQTSADVSPGWAPRP